MCVASAPPPFPSLPSLSVIRSQDGMLRSGEGKKMLSGAEMAKHLTFYCNKSVRKNTNFDRHWGGDEVKNC